MQTTFADIENLSGEELERIKTKYNLVSGRGSPQNILDEDIRVFQARTSGKTCMVGTPGRHYNLGKIPSSRYTELSDMNKIHELEWSSGSMEIPFASEYPDKMMESIITGGKETLRIINNIQLLPQVGTPNEHLLPEELRLHLIDSRYTAEWMYPTNFMVTPVLEDEINKEHEQFNLNFNIYRKSRGKSKIELKIGNVYTLELGKKEIRLKDMTLAKMGDVNKGIDPILYFTKNHNWVGQTWKDSALMNVSVLKIKKSSKE